jgi:hypothetical protein
MIGAGITVLCNAPMGDSMSTRLDCPLVDMPPIPALAIGKRLGTLMTQFWPEEETKGQVPKGKPHYATT